jgi:hypothetical protein
VLRHVVGGLRDGRRGNATGGAEQSHDGIHGAGDEAGCLAVQPGGSPVRIRYVVRAARRRDGEPAQGGGLFDR